MKLQGLITPLRCAMTGAVLLAAPAFLRAQAPAGPLPAESPKAGSSPAAQPRSAPVEVHPRTSILGAWKLNRDASDDPRKKMQDARRASGGGSRGGVRMGIPGMGGGPYGGHRRGAEDSESDQDRERMQALLAPSNSLTLLQKDAEVDLIDDQNRHTAFFTDGRKLDKSKDPNNQQVAAHWDANRLVTDEKNPRGGKLSRTYELSYDGTQLYETLLLPAGRSTSQLSVRYVFDQATIPQPQAKR
jgi:hypothetical protein